MSDGDGQPLFWRLFGGAVTGLVTVLLAAILNHLHVSVITARQEVAAVREEVAALREKVSALQQARDIQRESLQNIRAGDKERDKAIQDLKEKVLKLEARSP